MLNRLKYAFLLAAMLVAMLAPSAARADAKSEADTARMQALTAAGSANSAYSSESSDLANQDARTQDLSTRYAAVKNTMTATDQAAVETYLSNANTAESTCHSYKSYALTAKNTAGSEYGDGETAYGNMDYVGAKSYYQFAKGDYDSCSSWCSSMGSKNADADADNTSAEQIIQSYGG